MDIPTSTPDGGKPGIRYSSQDRPEAIVVAILYRTASLLRPIDDVDRIRQMYQSSNLVFSAWDGEELIGILRGWTDGAFDGYICDLAVHPDYQNQGIGQELLERARETSPQVQFVLRASKIAVDYYQHIRWQKIENGWFWPREPW
jgi:ribosomal protein S18 acetylase RimI-like enzyme